MKHGCCVALLAAQGLIAAMPVQARFDSEVFTGTLGNAPIVMDGGLWSGFTPGEHWAYSNTGYELLSRAIAQAASSAFTLSGSKGLSGIGHNSLISLRAK